MLFDSRNYVTHVDRISIHNDDDDDDDDRRRHPLQVTSKMIDNAMVVLHIAEAVVMGRMIEENSITVKSHFELNYTTLFSVVGPTL